MELLIFTLYKQESWPERLIQPFQSEGKVDVGNSRLSTPNPRWPMSPNKGSEDANQVCRTMDNREKTYKVKGPGGGELRTAWSRKQERTGKRSRNNG